MKNKYKNMFGEDPRTYPLTRNHMSGRDIIQT